MINAPNYYMIVELTYRDTATGCLLSERLLGVGETFAQRVEDVARNSYCLRNDAESIKVYEVCVELGRREVVEVPQEKFKSELDKSNRIFTLRREISQCNLKLSDLNSSVEAYEKKLLDATNELQKLL